MKVSNLTCNGSVFLSMISYVSIYSPTGQGLSFSAILPRDSKNFI